MEYRKLGTSDLEVSVIGMGCVTFGREIDPATSFDVLDRAVERGINLLDTAAAYGKERASENLLGEWFTDRGYRDSLILASKMNGDMSAAAVSASVEESLRCLQTDRIDLFQLHHWPNEDHPLEETLEALDRLVRGGAVRYIGISNTTGAQLQSALELQQEKRWARFVSIQPQFNLVNHREIEDDIFPVCRRESLGVLGYSPIGAGFLTGKYGRDRVIPHGTRFEVVPGHDEPYFHDHGFAVLDDLRSLSESSGRSMIDLALAWTFAQNDVTTVLIGARNTDQVDQAFTALENPLSKEEEEALDRAGAST